MFNRSQTNGGKKTEANQAVHSLLGKGTLWKGDIHSGPNSIRIEGTVEGSIFSEGEVTIAPTGLIKGTIRAKHLIVTGKVEGVFKISECLEIHGTGWVEGEVEVGSLVVDEGGTLQGSCTRKGARPKEAGKEAGREMDPKGKPKDAEPVKGRNSDRGDASLEPAFANERKS